jgi:hypothetical protein
MKTTKIIFNFAFIFILSFFITEILEQTLDNYFNFDFQIMTWGWFGLLFFYGFKYHIICCIVPLIWAGYKCRHKSCKHEYCNDKIEHTN